MSVHEIQERLEAQLRYVESLDNGYLIVDCSDLHWLLARIAELEAALKEIYREADDGLPYPILALNNIAFIAARALAEKEREPK